MKLNVTDWQLAICKLDQAKLPQWAEPSVFLNFSISPNEVSLVCEQALVPQDLVAERGWRCFIIDGELDFSLVGIVAKITSILAEKNISVFVLSTFDTDYILIKDERFQDALYALEESGYQIL